MSVPIMRALHAPGFRRLFLAQTVSRWGDTFNFIALVVVVFQLTGSGLKVAATVGFEILPVLLFGFAAGAVVDRLSRRKVMIAADLARASVALVLVLQHDSLVMLYAAAFLLSAFSTFFNPAAASVVPALVEDEDIVGANSVLWSAAVISQIVLAPVAGAVVAFAGAGAAFGINAASFILSALLLLRLDVGRDARPVASRALDDVKEGLAVVRRSLFLRVLAAVQVLAALSAGATSALLVVLAADHLGAGPTRFGFLLTAIGIGAAAGPLVLQRYVREVRTPALLFGPYLLRGAVDLVLALSSSFTVALGALAAYGVGTSTGTVTYNTALQKSVADRLRGRVFATYDVIWQTGRLVSIGVGGVLADAAGIQTVYVLGGLVLLLAGTLGLVLVPTEEMRRAVKGWNHVD